MVHRLKWSILRTLFTLLMYFNTFVLITISYKFKDKLIYCNNNHNRLTSVNIYSFSQSKKDELFFKDFYSLFRIMKGVLNAD